MLRLASKITSKFELNGFCLRSDATKYLCQLLESVDSVSERDEWLERILETLHKQPLISPVIGRTILETVIKECTEPDDDDAEKAYSIINAFSIPNFAYNQESKKFVLKELLGQKSSLHANAEGKINMFLERYKIVHQRTVRHHLFAPPVIEALRNQSFSLKPIEYLLGTVAKQGNVIILGMLAQLKEGKIYLEDPSGVVQLDLTNAVYKGGLFTENSFVLAEGSYEDGVFHVTAIGFPPPEPAKVTMKTFSNQNFFGGSYSSCVRVSEKLDRLEKRNPDAMFVIVSDVWLDQLKVMEKMKILLAGYSEMPPTLFILLGNFVSTHKGKQHAKVIRECLKNLAEMIAEFPKLVRDSHFIFVPGANDPGFTTILPRPPIPNALTTEFSKKIPKSTFTTNPCRIQYCTQEIVVIREDLVSKMCRNAIHMPWEQEDQVNIPSLFVKTLVGNAHLCPLPQSVSPVYWEYDHALRLYPLPDVVICGDRYDPFCVTSAECIFLNPGSFTRTHFSFKVYQPISREVEDSQITDIPS